MSQKLPKQWRHWCKKAGLRPHTAGKGTGRHGRKAHQWFHLKGHGRVWRVNCHERFECGDTYVEFDRWALCSIEDAPRPTTQAEFVDVVRELLTRQRANAEVTDRASAACEGPR